MGDNAYTLFILKMDLRLFDNLIIFDNVIESSKPHKILLKSLKNNIFVIY